MLNVEARFIVAGQEVSPGSFAEVVVRKVRQSVREEISRTLGQPIRNSALTQSLDSKVPPQAVSVREVARLMSISPRTVEKYIALKVIAVSGSGGACHEEMHLGYTDSKRTLLTGRGAWIEDCRLGKHAAVHVQEHTRKKTAPKGLSLHALDAVLFTRILRMPLPATGQCESSPRMSVIYSVLV